MRYPKLRRGATRMDMESAWHWLRCPSRGKTLDRLLDMRLAAGWRINRLRGRFQTVLVVGMVGYSPHP